MILQRLKPKKESNYQQTEIYNKFMLLAYL